MRIRSSLPVSRGNRCDAGKGFKMLCAARVLKWVFLIYIIFVSALEKITFALLGK